MAGTTQEIKTALAEYVGVSPEQVGSFAIVFETEVDEQSSLHTAWTDGPPFMYMKGILAELEYQIMQARMKNEAKATMEALMGEARNGEV